MAQQDWEHSRDIVLPFDLPLDDGRVLVCEELLRVLPGRRLVCRARLAQQTVLVKLFMGSKADREARSDAHGIRAMMAAAIETPPLLEENQVQGKGYPVLLFEFVQAARSCRDSWSRAGEDERSILLNELLALVARQHQAGLRQRDFHLNNFLLDESGRLYAIDGGDFIVARRPVSRRHSVKNLGALFGHLPREALAQPGILESYLQQRGWQADGGFYRQVRKAADDFRHRRARRISRKGFRSCSEFLLRRKGPFKICQRRDFDPQRLDAWMQDSRLAPRAGEPILKPGNSQTVWASEFAGREVVVKRYNLKNRWHALRRMFSRSRASRSWENALRLRAYHIATPEPLAMIEERRFGFRQRAWLITEKALGQGANHYILQHDGDDNLQRLARVARAFGDNGLVHGDMKATNFFMDDIHVQAIDLDSMFRPWTAPVRRARIQRDRQRFLRNWQGELRQRFSRFLVDSRD